MGGLATLSKQHYGHNASALLALNEAINKLQKPGELAAIAAAISSLEPGDLLLCSPSWRLPPVRRLVLPLSRLRR